VSEGMTARKWGGWRVLKTAFALAHSGAILFLAISLMQFFESAARPGPRDPMAGLAAGILYGGLLLLGVPWSVAVFVLLGDPGPLSAWAMAHKWVPLTLTFLADGLNSGLLWFWALRRPPETPFQYSGIGKRIALIVGAALLLMLAVAFPHVPPYRIIGWSRVAVTALALLMIYRGVRPKRRVVTGAAE
jgi:hypothetical protein